jgi:hypothetical protein
MKHIIVALLGVLLACTGALGQLMLMTGAGAGSGLAPFALSFVTNAQETTGASGGVAVNFAGVNVGTDVTGADKRFTVLGTGVRTAGVSGNFTAATICGVAANAIQSTGSTNNEAGLWYADTSGLGASCTISVTFSVNSINTGIGVWRLINPTGGSATPVANTCHTDSASNTATLSININAGGSAAAYVASSNATDRTWTWTGLTENFDADIENNSATHAAATGGSPGTPTTITALASGASEQNGCSASWAP